MSRTAESTDSSAPRWRLVGLTVTFAVLAWVSNAAVLAFDRFGYTYSDPLSVRRLAGEIVSIGPIDVVAGFFNEPFFGFVNIAMLVSLIAITVVETVLRDQRRVVILTITALSLPIGLLAFASMASSWSVGLDGEWLGESWPILDAFALWTAALCAYSASDLLAARASKRAVPAHLASAS